MTAELENSTINETKKDKSKSKGDETGAKRSFEDDHVHKRKKKFKKNKKAKKDVTAAEEIEESNVEEPVDETMQEDQEDNEGKKVKAKEPSKRKLKKEKAEARAAVVKEVGKQESAQKALNYISKWKHAKSEWKFNKVTQIWLMNNLLNDDYIPDDQFTTVLEYFEGCKGAARKQLIDKAMAVVKKIEDSVEEDEEAVETTEYNRARQLLQALPVET